MRRSDNLLSAVCATIGLLIAAVLWVMGSK